MHGTSQAEILRIRRENFAAERAEKARKEKAKSAEKERLYDRLQAIGGLWKTPEAVDEGLEKQKTGKRGDLKHSYTIRAFLFHSMALYVFTKFYHLE